MKRTNKEIEKQNLKIGTLAIILAVTICVTSVTILGFVQMA